MTSVRRLLAILICLAATARGQDGLYADFSTTLGNFTCQLEYTIAPRTVANFIGLASGSRAWQDIPTGEAKRTPFYNGISFHRVVAGFVIQGGSPNGQGTDGPGYTFKDEFDPTLRHDAAGVLSMANSGLHSNGSQFFVTLAATAHLNDVHSIFGRVTSGLSVVQAIGAVAVDGNSKPTVPVLMNSVVIRRVGAAAQAFNEQNQGLPSVGGAKPVLVKNGANFALQFNRALYSDYWLYDSGALATWNRQHLGLYVTTPPVTDLDVTATTSGQANHFYRVSQIAYPGPIYTPPGVAGATLTLTLSNGQVLTLIFNTAGGGTFNLTTPGQGPLAGTIVQSTWTQEAYRGRLVCYTDSLPPLVIDHAFSSGTAGTFKGTAYSNPQSQLSGTFTHTAP